MSCGIAALDRFEPSDARRSPVPAARAGVPRRRSRPAALPAGLRVAGRRVPRRDPAGSVFRGTRGAGGRGVLGAGVRPLGGRLRRASRARLCRGSPAGRPPRAGPGRVRVARSHAGRRRDDGRHGLGSSRLRAVDRGDLQPGPRGFGPDPALGDPHRRGRALPRGRGASRIPGARVRARGHAAAALAPPRLRRGRGPRAAGRDPASLLQARAAPRALAAALAAVRARRRPGGGRARPRRRRQERSGGRDPRAAAPRDGGRPSAARRRRSGRRSRPAWTRLSTGSGRSPACGHSARRCRFVRRGGPGGTWAGSGRDWDSSRTLRYRTPTGGASISGRSRPRPGSRASRWDGGPPGPGPARWSSKTGRCSPARRTVPAPTARPFACSSRIPGKASPSRRSTFLAATLRAKIRRRARRRRSGSPSFCAGRSVGPAPERSSSSFSPPTRTRARALWGAWSSSTASAALDGKAPTAVPAKEASRSFPVDAAPSILARVGIPPARDLAGRPVASLFAPGTLETATVASYGPRVAPPASTAPERDQEYLEKLRSLGYLQ